MSPHSQLSARRRLARGALAVAIAAAAALAWPPVGRAAVITFGSTLAAPATLAEAHGGDAAFWPTAIAGGQTFVAPASGQILTIRLKGIAQANPAGPPPLTQVHFQDLRPQPDGSVKVIVTSNPFNVPDSGDPNQVSTFQPVNFCVAQGDFVDFNDEGGFVAGAYPNGVPYQMFGRVPGSVTDFFTQANGTNNGADFKGQPLQDEELLMQMDQGTGPDATPLCPGGGSNGSASAATASGSPPAAGAPAGGGLSSMFGTNAPSLLVPAQTDKLSRKTKTFNASLVAHSPSPCTGGAALYSGGKIVSPPAMPTGPPLATANFTVPAGQTGTVPMTVTNSAILKKLRKRRKHVTVSLYTLATCGFAKSSDAGAIVLKGGR